jgi:hypothetical protein
MTHQHNSNGREWLMVEVQGDTITVDMDTMPNGRWSYHSDSLTITEEQAGEIVNPIGVMYEDYEYPEDLFMTATLSYRSLLRSLQINSRVINLVRI